MPLTFEISEKLCGGITSFPDTIHGFLLHGSKILVLITGSSLST
jgi:hypothetical protein